VVRNGAGGVTTKSSWLEEHVGHKNPTMFGTEHYFMNAVGLSDAGIAKAKDETFPEYLADKPAPIIASIVAVKLDDFSELTEQISECNPDMDDWVCESSLCQLCVEENDGVFCPKNMNLCNEIGGKCEYLDDEVINDDDGGDPGDDDEPGNEYITLISPADESSYDDPTQIDFSFKVKQSYMFEICELILNGESVATKNRPISLSTQNLSFFVEEGESDWEIKCTKRTNYDSEVEISETRNLLVGDVEILNTDSIDLTSPVNGYSVQGEQEINFIFDITEDLSEISQCNLILNSETYDMELGEINTQNTYSRTIPIGEYSWNVECLNNADNAVSISCLFIPE